MKIEAPKKPNKEAAKWEEHMNKKTHTQAKGPEAEITHAKKKQSVAPSKGKVEVVSHKEKAVAKEVAKAAQKHDMKKAAPVAKKEEHKPVKAEKAKNEKSGVSAIAREVSVEEKLDDLNILKHPLVTEKAVNMIEDENKLTFVVDKNATKPTIKGAVESLYKVRVKKVSILNDMKARKRAIVTLNKEFKASDIATKLGVI